MQAPLGRRLTGSASYAQPLGWRATPSWGPLSRASKQGRRLPSGILLPHCSWASELRPTRASRRLETNEQDSAFVIDQKPAHDLAESQRTDLAGAVVVASVALSKTAVATPDALLMGNFINKRANQSGCAPSMLTSWAISVVLKPRTMGRITSFKTAIS